MPGQPEVLDSSPTASGISKELGGQLRSPEIVSSLIAQPSLSFVHHDDGHVQSLPHVQEAAATNVSVTSDLANATPRPQERELPPMRALHRPTPAERALAQISLKSAPAPVVEDKTITLGRGLRAQNFLSRDYNTRRQSRADHASSISSTSTTTVPTYVSSSPQFSNLRGSPDASTSASASEGVESEQSSGGRSTIGGHTHTRSGTRLSKSPSGPTSRLPHTASPFPPALIPLLDGEHHTDELCVRFNVGWPMLEQWLVMAGGGEGNGDYGNVSIIYR